MKRTIFLQFILLIAIVFALSCARQTTPTGGPKDSIPPTVVRTTPEDQQVNFSGQQIEATFSEFVQLNNAKEQIIITPGVGKDFQAIVKKNKVVITLTSPLQPNTTYTVNYRDAVQDITEKNPAQNLHIAFSTGSYIDSLHIFGSVYELLSAKEGKDATVALYEQDTFNIFRHKPSYFTKADATGQFHIDNLKPGSYHVYAWLDNNKNLLVDSKSEAYGFVPGVTQPQDTTAALTIPVIKLDSRPLKLTSARPSQTFFNIKTSKSTEFFSIHADDATQIFASYGEDPENIRVYNTMRLAAGDSLPITLMARDSLLQSLDTTLYMKFAEREIKPGPFQFNNKLFTLSASTGLLHGVLNFNKPVLLINHDSLFYRVDSTQLVHIEAADITYDSTRTVLTISKKIDRALLQPKPAQKTGARPKTAEPRARDTTLPARVPGQPGKKTAPKATRKLPQDYELTLADAAFISVEGDSSNGTAIALKPTTMETTGVIIVELKTAAQPLLVQVLSRGDIIATQTATKKATFSDLTPGEYTVRVIVDTDHNNRWSPGNIFLNQPPEPIHFYKNEQGQPSVILKANWERDLLITF